MESLKKKYNNLPLRKFFVISVLFTICFVAALSGMVIFGCTAFRHYLLPDPNAVYLTIERTLSDGSTVTSVQLFEFDDDPQKFAQLVSDQKEQNTVLDEKYSIQKIEKSYDTMGPRRKLAYQSCGVIMAAFPAVSSIIGILLCGLYFYKRKLAEPLKLLSDATAKIASKDLDFSIQYGVNDEMGALCQSFEHMRMALYENNKFLWKMLEERKLMQASIAHDLRNPIAIIEGYTEYLQLNLPNGKLSIQRILRISDNLNKAAKRLEYYTESIRRINQLEDVELNLKETPVLEFVKDIEDDFSVIASGLNIHLIVTHDLQDCLVKLDGAVVYRILENVFGNAMRFAKEKITISFSINEQNLLISVSDDGCGFPDDILKNKSNLLLPKPKEDGHMGIGLTISRILCQKHGGNLELSNHNGATVKIIIGI